VFHSTAKEPLPYAANLQFAVIAEPDKRLYSEFGVEYGPRALLDQRAWDLCCEASFEASTQFFAESNPLPP
jgi:hypothetical protein